MASEAVNAMRAKIAYFGRMLFDRHLTDAGVGNISVRVGEFVFMSATYAGQKHQWQINPEDVLVLDKDGNPIYSHKPTKPKPAKHGLVPVKKSCWWAGVKTGRFPKPVKLGPRVTAWRVEDIRALIASA